MLKSYFIPSGFSLPHDKIRIAIIYLYVFHGSKRENAKTKYEVTFMPNIKKNKRRVLCIFVKPPFWLGKRYTGVHHMICMVQVCTVRPVWLERYLKHKRLLKIKSILAQSFVQRDMI